MNCHEIMKHLSEFIDGDLDDCQCDVIRGHLDDCPECRTFLDTFRKTIDVSKKLLRTEIPDEIRARLRDRLREEYKKHTGTI